MSPRPSAPRYRIGIDVGGTFTDLFLLDETSGAVARHKLLSTPGEPHRAPLAGIREILATLGGRGADVGFVGLGTTVMTNALLERKGAATGLITTAGFRDLLEIARQIRPHTFDPFVSKPEPLVPRQLRLEVGERIAADGTVITPLDRASLERAIEALQQAGVKAIAVCLLNSYANPAHERAIADALRTRWPGAHVSISTDVLPEFREYERLSSTVVNAYLMPVTREYFRGFDAEVAQMGVPEPPFIMNSGGGIMTPDQAGERPIDTLFSGPSGGVSGAVHTSQVAGLSEHHHIRYGRHEHRCVPGSKRKAPAFAYPRDQRRSVESGGTRRAHCGRGRQQHCGYRCGRHALRRSAQRRCAAGPRVLYARWRRADVHGRERRARPSESRLSAGRQRSTRFETRAAAIEQHSRNRTAFPSWKRRIRSSRSPIPTWRMPCVSFRSNADWIPATSCWSRSAARVLCMRPRSRASSGSDRCSFRPRPVCCARWACSSTTCKRTSARPASARRSRQPDCIAVVDGVYRELEAKGRNGFSGEKTDSTNWISPERSVGCALRGQNHELTVTCRPGPFTAQALGDPEATFPRGASRDVRLRRRRKNRSSS